MARKLAVADLHRDPICSGFVAFVKINQTCLQSQLLQHLSFCLKNIRPQQCEQASFSLGNPSAHACSIQVFFSPSLLEVPPPKFKVLGHRRQYHSKIVSLSRVLGQDTLLKYKYCHGQGRPGKTQDASVHESASNIKARSFLTKHWPSKMPQ